MISSLRVQNFRVHDDFAVEFREGMTVITGPNGSGKTSLIEAIYLCLSGKSWRSNFAEILRNDDLQATADWWRIDLEFSSGEQRTVKFQANCHPKLDLGSEISQKKVGGYKNAEESQIIRGLANDKAVKTFDIDGKSFARLPAKYKKPIVLFEPNDLQLLYGSPARRRQFFDRFIAELVPEHQTNLNKFERILRQRNNLLKKEAKQDELFVWDLQFSDLSEKISRARRDATKLLNQNLSQKYAEIAGKNDAVNLKFLPGGPLDQQEIMAELSRQNPYQTTPIGAQKDDVKFLLNKKLAKTAASRGENRTIIFAILARQIEILRQNNPEVFVILDDIDSELDDVRKSNIYKISTPNDSNLLATTLKFKGAAANLIKLK